MAFSALAAASSAAGSCYGGVNDDDDGILPLLQQHATATTAFLTARPAAGAAAAAAEALELRVACLAKAVQDLQRRVSGMWDVGRGLAGVAGLAGFVGRTRVWIVRVGLTLRPTKPNQTKTTQDSERQVRSDEVQARVGVVQELQSLCARGAEVAGLKAELQALRVALQQERQQQQREQREWERERQRHREHERELPRLEAAAAAAAAPGGLEKEEVARLVRQLVREEWATLAAGEAAEMEEEREAAAAAAAVAAAANLEAELRQLREEVWALREARAAKEAREGRQREREEEMVVLIEALQVGDGVWLVGMVGWLGGDGWVGFDWMELKKNTHAPDTSHQADVASLDARAAQSGEAQAALAEAIEGKADAAAVAEDRREFLTALMGKAAAADLERLAEVAEALRKEMLVRLCVLGLLAVVVVGGDGWLQKG